MACLALALGGRRCATSKMFPMGCLTFTRSNALGYLSDLPMMNGNGSLESLANIAKEVPPIDDLTGVGSSGPNAFGKDFGAIASDDLDGRMSFEPVRQRAGIAIGKEIDDLVSLQIDDHRSVSPSAAPGPLVDADDTRLCGWKNVMEADKPQEGISARVHPKTAGQPFASFTAKCQTQMALDIPQSFGTTRVRAGSSFEPLRECTSTAVRVSTDEAANLNTKANRLSLPG